MNRWLITVRIVENRQDIIRTVVHRNKKRIVDFQEWRNAYLEEEGIQAVSILNIEKLPPKAKGV